MNEAISPEEKLLRHIRSPKKDNPERLEPARVDTSVSLKTSALAVKFPFKQLDPVDIMLAAGFIAALGYVIYIFLFAPALIKASAIPAGLSRLENTSAGQLAKRQPQKPVEFFLQQIGSKEIFNAQPKPQEPQRPVEVVVDPNIIKDITVIGIVMGDSPEAVIEDKKSLKTYYVRPGQYVGALKIEQIQEGKVTVSSGGQSFELFM